MIIKACAYTTKYAKKPVNEDGLFVNEVVISDGYYHTKVQAETFNVCLCDGVTGADKGFYASQFILQSIANAEYLDFNDFQKILVNINKGLIKEGERINAIDMSSTLAGVYFDHNKATIYHVGDSRVYKMQNSFLACLTDDDALAFRLFKDGVIARKDIKTHPQRNTLINYFGNSSDFHVNFSDDLNPRNAKYLICSDGLSDFVDEKKIDEILSMDIDGFDMLRLLVGETIKKGCNDDVSAIIIEVLE